MIATPVASAMAAPEATVLALLGGSSLVMAALFIVLMTVAGFVLGRFLGNEDRLLSGSLSGRSPVTDELRRQTKEAVAALVDGELTDSLPDLLRQIQGPELVEELFAGAPLDDLLGALAEVGPPDDERRPVRDQLLRLLSRIAANAADEPRMRILGGMIKALRRNRNVAPFLVDVCRRAPEVWNDVQPSLEEAGQNDSAIAKYIRQHAGPTEGFVREFTEQHMTEMVRFRRLCEERAIEPTPEVDVEIYRLLVREFDFLKLAGTVTRRFNWLPAQAKRFHPLVSEEMVDLLLREAHAGISEVHALLGQLALAGAIEGDQEHRSRRILSALEEAARTHPSAANALLEIYTELKPDDAAEVFPERESVRRRAYFALLSAAEHSFEVIKLLGAHGIPRDLYGSSDRY